MRPDTDPPGECPIAVPRPFWVFGYGSLMWRPGFSFAEAAPALVRGHHRSLCVYSTRYRGTEARPGLVLGLDRGGSCRGLAFRVADADADAAAAYLYQREMVGNVYIPRQLGATLRDGRRVSALAFVARPGHPKYAGGLPPDEAARLVRQGRGSSGSNLDYLRNTLDSLAAMNIRDHALERILALAGNDAVNAPAS